METTAPKQSIATRSKNFLRRNERRILVTITVVSVTGNVLMRAGIKQHNEFLKEHGLYEQFYALNEEAA